MSENEYVATAAAQKRLREVLGGYLGHIDSRITETFADALLAVSKVEYKSRAKQVVISLDLPGTTTLSEMGTAADLDQAVTEVPLEKADAGQGFSPDDTADNAAKPEPVPPTPHIAAFAPSSDYEPTEDDVHFD